MAKSTFAAGVQLVGFEGSSSSDGKNPPEAAKIRRRRQNPPEAAKIRRRRRRSAVRAPAAATPPPPQAFGWSGSISEGSKTAADVQLFGLQQGGNVKER